MSIKKVSHMAATYKKGGLNIKNEHIPYFIMSLSDKDRAVNYIANLYGNSGINENTVYRIFRNFIKNENEAINAAREFINNECDVKTVKTKLFKKSAFL